MTVDAAEPLPRSMLNVTKGKTKRAGVCSGARKCLLVMTNTTRRDFASTRRFTAGRVAQVTLIVSRQACRNGKGRSGASAQSAVTRRTPTLRPGVAGVVLSMIEFDIEALVKL